MKKNISMPQPTLNQNFKNTTVAPRRAPNTLKTSPCSPRNHSKTKIRLVSPLNKTEQTVFVSKVNQLYMTTPVPQMNSTLDRPNFIQLGGRTISKNKENTVMSPRAFQKMNNTIVFKAAPQPILRDQSMILPHPTKATYVQRIVRNVSPCRITFNNQLQKSVQESLPTFATYKTHQRQDSNLSSQIVDRTTRSVNISGIVEVKQGIPTELVIREENNIEELKQNYKNQLAQIKKLRDQININNLEIKKLLKSNNSLKEQVHLEQQNEPASSTKEEKNLKQSCSSLVLHKESQQELIKPPSSKKTLIQGLYFQTNNVFEQSQQIKKKMQVCAQTDAVLKESSNESIRSSKNMKLSLTKIEQCQVMFMPPITQKSEQSKHLEGSIVYQNHNNEQNNNRFKQLVSKQEHNTIVYNMTEIKPGSSQSSIKSKSSKQIIANYTIPLNKEQIDIISKVEYPEHISKKTIEYTPKRDTTKEISQLKQVVQNQNLLPVSQVIVKDQQQNSVISMKTSTKPSVQQQIFQQIKQIVSNTSKSTQKVQVPQQVITIQGQEKKGNRRISNRMYL